MATNSYELGHYFCDNPHHALLHHALVTAACGDHNFAVEFGVGEGHSLRCISRYMPVIGFDSFQGLPEDWRPGFDAGMFACDPPMNMPANATLVVGKFEDTLRDSLWWGLNDIRLIHIDCDLYSSTKTVLENLPWKQLMHPIYGRKPIIVFDEWWGYPEAEQHEQRAWKEFAAQEPWLQWEVLGHGVQQWAIQLV